MQYMLSLVPQQSALRLEEKWALLLAYRQPLKLDTLAVLSLTAIVGGSIARAELHCTGVKFKPCYVISREAVYLKVLKERFATKGGIIRTVENRFKTLRSQMAKRWPSQPQHRRPIKVCDGLARVCQKQSVNAFDLAANNGQREISVTQIKASWYEAYGDEQVKNVVTPGTNSLPRPDY